MGRTPLEPAEPVNNPWAGRSSGQGRPRRSSELTTKSALRILHALACFMATGEGDVKRLQDIDPKEYRLRVGDYRVRFHDAGGGIELLSVRHRREAYR